MNTLTVCGNPTCYRDAQDESPFCSPACHSAWETWAADMEADDDLISMEDYR